MLVLRTRVGWIIPMRQLGTRQAAEDSVAPVAVVFKPAVCNSGFELSAPILTPLSCRHVAAHTHTPATVAEKITGQNRCAQISTSMTEVPLMQFASTERYPWTIISSHSSRFLHTSYNLMHLSTTETATRRSKSTFVSSHNTSLNVTTKAIVGFCEDHGIISNQSDHKITNRHVILQECPFCTKPTKGQADNFFKLYINIGNGVYFCHRCGGKGSWFDFKRRLGQGGAGGDFEVVDIRNSGYGADHTMHHTSKNVNRQFTAGEDVTEWNNSVSGTGAKLRGSCSPMPHQRLAASYTSNLCRDDNPRSKQALEYLTQVRGLYQGTIVKYGVGLAIYKFPSAEHNRYVEADCITFPWIMRAEDVREQEALIGNEFLYDRHRRQNSDEWEGDGWDGDGQDGDGTYTKKKEINDSSNESNNNDMGPWLTRRIKARALCNKGWQRLDPPGGGWGLFGWHTVPHDATEIVLTEGEYDAMAVYQDTGMPAVSLPNGCRSLPVDVLPLLENFEKIFLWMDADAPGREGAQTFAQKIGLGRCLIVEPSPKQVRRSQEVPKDANDALQKGLNLSEIIMSAAPIQHERILSFSQLRQNLLHEICNPDQYVGVPVPSLPKFTQIIKGFRKGELSILTGPTGSGKTTFLGQLSVDFAEQGINTLWGSFEIKNTRLLQKLLQQFARHPLAALVRSQDHQLHKKESNVNAQNDEGNKVNRGDSLEKLNAIMDRFDDLPLHFMKFHGGSDVDDVLDAMEYATYVNDVEHIILDNLQFMLSPRRKFQPSFSNSFDKFEMQDAAVEKFRKFATEKNVHVTLVVHPRKEEEGTKLGMSSVYGTAKATQEADIVLILQNEIQKSGGGCCKYMEVKKNRFDGTVGSCPLIFNERTARYSDVGVDSGDIGRVSQKKASAAPSLFKSKSLNEEVFLDHGYRVVPKKS